MFNDLIDLLKIKSKNIEHYTQYPIALIFFIMLLLQFPSNLNPDGFGPSYVYSLSMSLIFASVFTFIEAAFFVFWFERIGKSHPFLTYLHYAVMLSIASQVPAIVVLLITQSINASPWIPVIGFLAVFIYIIFMYSANLAHAVSSSKKYAFTAILIVTSLQLIVQTFLFSALLS